MKLTYSYRLLACMGWAATLGLIECIAPTIVTSATVSTADDLPCYMRTQDGRIVNLQSLCSHTTPQPTQSNPATQQPTQRTRSPQTAPTQVGVSSKVRDAAGSHAHGNPDSDDGNY